MALKEAKAEAEARVEKALFEKAIGYACDDCHVSQHEGKVTVTPLKKHYPSDVTACIFWLKNRKPAEWRDRAELKVGQEQEIAGLPPDVLEELRRRFFETVEPSAIPLSLCPSEPRLIRKEHRLDFRANFAKTGHETLKALLIVSGGAAIA